CHRSQELERTRARRQYPRAVRAVGAPRRPTPRALEACSAALPTVRIIATRKIEWPRQRRPVPAHAPARALHHAQRHRIRARREGVIGELALARQNFGPGIEERTWLDRNPRPRSIDGAIGLSRVRLGLDRWYVNHRRSEHCKAQPSQTGFNCNRIVVRHGLPSWRAPTGLLESKRVLWPRAHKVVLCFQCNDLNARLERCRFASGQTSQILNKILGRAAVSVAKR